MRVVRIVENGGPEVLKLSEAPDPAPGPGEILVQVRAAAVNRADLLQCMGLYPAPPGVPPDIPGMEYAGEVIEVGSNVRRHRQGDRVLGLVGGGAFAEKLVTHQRESVAMPPGMDFAHAAAIPEAFITAFDALALQGGLRPNENVLIHAVASGVGTAASQLVSAMGARAIGTSRSDWKLKRCAAELGLAHPILVRDEGSSFEGEVRNLTQGRGADLALDLIGGSSFSETLSSLAHRGRVVLVGLLAGPECLVPLRTLLSKRITVIGTVLRSRELEEKIGVAQAFERQVLPFFQAGRLKPVVDTVLPMAQVQDAFRRMASNQTLGKVVLEW
jgi:putative PIG3 family NAD(P)H quinone oxidoreductase